MADKIVRTFGPVAFAVSAANVYTPASALVDDVITHLHVVNTAGTPAVFTLFISQSTGTETAGKEMFVSQAIAANGVYDWYGRLRISHSDFLVGHAPITVTIMGEGVQIVV
jgi:hypothetical protein